jgi:hypothetical protein
LAEKQPLGPDYLAESTTEQDLSTLWPLKAGTKRLQVSHGSTKLAGVGNYI